MMNTELLQYIRKYGSITFLIVLQLCIGLSCTNDESGSSDLDVITPTEEGTLDDTDDEDSSDDEDSDDEDSGGDEDMDSDEEMNNDEDNSDEENTGDNEDMEDDMDEESSDPNDCTVANFVFAEQNGLVNVEFENAEFSQDWELQSEGDSFSGEGYMVWTGAQNLGNPGVGTATFSIAITNPGTYQIIWNSAITIGDNGTDHNDTWLRFADADNFFGQRQGSMIFPNGTGKIPNPQGASSDGWFKVYRSGNNLDFKWQSLTSDNDGHEIFITFDSPGIYTMEISARSSGHAIDKFVLFNDSFSEGAAISNENELSTINCN